MAVKRKDVYRRLALEHVGAESIISEHTIVRAHDRSYPLLIKMFFSNNYGARNFAATDTKVLAEDWETRPRSWRYRRPSATTWRCGEVCG
jgi:hypothetical protein